MKNFIFCAVSGVLLLRQILKSFSFFRKGALVKILKLNDLIQFQILKMMHFYSNSTLQNQEFFSCNSLFKPFMIHWIEKYFIFRKKNTIYHGINLVSYDSSFKWSTICSDNKGTLMQI